MSAQVRPSDRMSVRNLCAYGVGIIGLQFPNTALAVLAMPVLTIGYGISPVTVGAVLMLGRIWDAITNPIIGCWSDRTRSRWGRRRPFIVAGAALTAAAYPLFWFLPTGAGEAVTLGWLVGGTLLLYGVFAIYSVPYLALAYELTPDPHERTRIQAWRSYFQIVPTLAAGWFLWFCQLPQFGSLAVGTRWLGCAVGVVILATCLPPGLLLREPYYRVAAATPPEPFWPVARDVLCNRPFRIVMGVIVTLMVGTGTTEALGFYVMSYHVYQGDTAAAGRLMGIVTSITAATTFAAIPFIAWASGRLGKKSTLQMCLWIYIAAAIAKWYLASPAHPWTWVFIGILTQVGSLGFWILVNSMKADVCDWDELSSGRRREGAYSAMGNLLQKGSLSLTYLLAGVLLQAIGFRPGQDAVQDPGTVLWLRIAFSAGPVLFLVICLLLLRRYPLDGERMRTVRSTLEERRTAV